jgi:beta-lactamase superfamily II metal-dependent hydrolase
MVAFTPGDRTHLGVLENVSVAAAPRGEQGAREDRSIFSLPRRPWAAMIPSRPSPFPPWRPLVSLRVRACLLLALALAAPCRGVEKKRGLDVYFIDTDGGAATLIVTPAGESILIDCGNPGRRDAERIHRTATKQAGLKAIDHFIVTHWHSDHYGGIGRLARLMPVKAYYNRGIPDKLDEDKAGFPVLIRAYKAACSGKSTVLKVGDEVKLEQAKGSPLVKLLCVCSNGSVLPETPGADPNPIAKEHKPHPVDKSDNAKSLGFVLSFGKWRFLDLGDLTWNIEYNLAAPSDKLGPIDVYQVTHHGLEISNNPVLIKTVQPRVAIFNNGPRKGGHPMVVGTLRRVPGIQGIYQVHRNLKASDAENTDADKIANDGRKKESGAGIHLSVAADAKTYTVQVGTKGKPRTYKTRDR